MKTTYLLPLCLWLLAACTAVQQSPQDAQSETERLNTWFAERFEEELQFSPLTLTMLGRKDRYDEIDDFSEQAEQTRLDWKRATVEEMQRLFDYDKLDAEGKLSYDIWEYQYQDAADGFAYRNHSYPFEQMGGVQSELPNFLLNFHKVEDTQDLEAYIKRIAALSTGIDQLRQRAMQAASQGIRPPRFAYQGAIDQSQNLLDGAPFKAGAQQDAPLWADAKSKIQALQDKGLLSEQQAGEQRLAVEQALRQHFGPSYSALIDWLREDVQSTSAEAQGVSSLPDGKAYYDYRLRHSTTTGLSADEVHAIGLSEVKRLRTAIEAIMDELKFEGTLQDFFAFIREDSQFFFPDTDAGRQGYIDGAQRYLDFIEQRLPEYFGLLPKAALVVKRVEAFREQEGAAQHYYPGTPDGSRPGVYYAHLSDMTAMPKNQMEVIAYHEGLPGHHMQVSIAQELESVPMFRTQTGFTAYVEGWALYTEILAGEMGAYQDLYSRVGQLSSEIWRAIRLVVDTGLHTRGWSEEQAVQFFMANSPEPEESIRSEVRRYIVWPGQATSYKIGMLKIMELREKARQAMGEDFDIRGFHDIVLGGGALPLSLLERRVETWMASAGAG